MCEYGECTYEDDLVTVSSQGSVRIVESCNCEKNQQTDHGSAGP